MREELNLIIKKWPKIVGLFCLLVFVPAIFVIITAYELLKAIKVKDSKRALPLVCGIFMIINCNFFSFSNWFRLDYPVALFIQKPLSISENMQLKTVEVDGYEKISKSGQYGLVKYDKHKLTDRELNKFYKEVVDKHFVTNEDGLEWITLIDESDNTGICFYACTNGFITGKVSKETGRLIDGSEVKQGILKVDRKIKYYDYKEIQDKCYDGKKFLNCSNEEI